MLNTLQAANHLILKHSKTGGISHMRLHHLIYCCQGLAHASSGDIQFDLTDLPKAYGFGPTYEVLLPHLQRHGEVPITELIRIGSPGKYPLPNPDADHRSIKAIRHMDMITEKFAHFSDQDLSRYCRQPGGAWSITPLREEISIANLTNEFKSLLQPR